MDNDTKRFFEYQLKLEMLTGLTLAKFDLKGPEGPKTDSEIKAFKLVMLKNEQRIADLVDLLS